MKHRILIGIFGILIFLLGLSAATSAQSWTRLDEPPGVLKQWSPLVIKEWITAADSGNTMIVGSDTCMYVKLGILPDKAYAEDILLNVQTAFNSDSTDMLAVGVDDDVDKYLTSTDVSATGEKSVSLATNYVSSADTLYLFYIKDDVFWPPAGKAAVVIRYNQMPD